MIVPMKKVSLVILGDKKEEALIKLRRLGLVHVEISEGSGEKLVQLQEDINLIYSVLFTIGKKKKVKQKSVSAKEALEIAKEIAALDEEKKECQAQRVAYSGELERVKSWGEINPEELALLASKGYEFSFYEMPKPEYDELKDSVDTLPISLGKSSVRFLLPHKNVQEDTLSSIKSYQFELPELSTQQMRDEISKLEERIGEIDEKIAQSVCYVDSLKKAVEAVEKEVEFETYATGMGSDELSAQGSKSTTVAYFRGYIEAENIDKLCAAAAANSWGLLVEDPCEEDNVPTKLKNNKFVSLIYPLTDFLGTVPGYFEYDISAWFLMFILIFFGIIFGDGGYGLFICTIASLPIIKSLVQKKPVSPTFLLVELFGLSTILWGTLTCTWFGLSPEQIPVWLQKLSIPLISNVYADKIWYPFWTNGEAGLTTAQNLQIFCFTLALIQLTVAHIKGAVRSKGSVKILGDIGSILQLLGIYYVVLSFVVNAQVFSFDLVLAGVEVGKVAIGLIIAGFVLSFVFSNYQGNLLKSILASVTNIVSVLLGVVNVFSDIVSYIRLWAVGLAGAAISATVNELAGPLLGNFMFMILAIVLLVFGHGLNMILNILSVIVHGIRLNTLEFSSHLDMSWSGHKFKPFKE